MASPNERTAAISGTGTIDISSQWMHNVITVLGVSSGIVTVKAMPAGSTQLEYVQDGTITLPNERTISIRNVALKQLELTHSEGSAFTVRVTQYVPDRSTVY